MSRAALTGASDRRAGRPELGFDRVSFVRLAPPGSAENYAEVHGTRHRRPSRVVVPSATAAALVEAGVPAFVRGPA